MLPGPPCLHKSDSSPAHLGRVPELFVKRCEAVAAPAAYPDLGCTFERFTNADLLELETLGPLTTLAPAESVSWTR